jgi:lyso-ornithine lipid O-acyltransferase
MSFISNIIGRLLAVIRMIIVIALVAVHGILVAMVPEKSHRIRAKVIQSFGRTLTWTLGIRVVIVGQPSPERAILISNHRSYADIPILAGLCPVVFLAKSEISSWPIIGFAARKARTVFVDRHDPKSREHSRIVLKERLKEGFSVLVFSEGTTSARGTLEPLKPGMFHEAATAQLPIQLVYIEFAEDEDSWIGDESVAHHFFNRFSRLQTVVKVVYRNEVLYADQTQNSPGHHLCNQATNWLKDQIRSELGSFRN